jgi:hypothetical protein
MEYNKEVLGRQYPVVYSLIKHIASHRGLNATWDRNSYPSEFWSTTVAGHLHLALIEWCKVFGSDSEDIHWKKTPIGNTAQQAIENFRQRILDKNACTSEEWRIYHKSLVDMRGKYVTHLDLKEPITGTVPVFDVALKIAYAYEEWINDIIQQNPSKPLNFNGFYDCRMKDASSIASAIRIPEYH